MKAIALIAAAAALAGCAAAPIEVPAPLAAASGEQLLRVVPARGVQIYECRVADGKAGWAFVAPDARLLDSRGTAIGHHGAGPYWEARDGSRIVGTVKARSDSPVDGAVPWLLLATRSTGAEGDFSRVTSVQRVNTAGGVAPATACTPPMAGKSVRVDYTADYYFYTAR